MRNTLDPIFVRPRMLPRRWGRADLGDWCATAARPPLPVGEAWLMHPANTTDDDRHLGERLSSAPQDMLGDLGRAPPVLRLVFADAETDPLFSDSSVAFWRVIDAPFGAQCKSRGSGAASHTVRCRSGDAFRLSQDGFLQFPRGVTALEARASFAPRNRTEQRPPVLRVQLDMKPARATLLRDAALSVERWRLPDESQLEPDGETCHALTALTPGVSLDGRALARGEAVFIPACGRRMRLYGGGEVLVAYPDIVPTAIWRTAPRPDPAASALKRPTAPEVVPAFAQGFSPPGLAAA